MNTSTPWVYNGPRFNYTYKSLNVAFTFLREQCGAYYGPGREQWVHQVADCMLNNASQQMLANLNSHTYLATLWPAFISIIVAMGADAAPVAYDSLAWALLFALTSASMPGFHAPPLPHQVTCRTREEAEAICQRRPVDGSDNPEARARFSTTRPPESYLSRSIDWILLAFCVVLWAAFVGYYLYNLASVTYLSTDEPWGWGAIWYMVAAAPGVAEGVARVLVNNVDVYEPVVADSAATSPKDESPELFTRRENPTGAHAWLRVASLQLRGLPYRVLVHPMPRHPLVYFFEYLVYLGRMAVFVWGSIVQGTFLFMLAGDVWCLVLVIVVTVTPRALWPSLWKRSRGGADLVVWHVPVL